MSVPKHAGAPTVTGDLTEILTPPQVAKRAGWTRKRMWAYLVYLNKKHDGLLLVDISRGNKRPRWTVSMQSLKLLNAAWFQDPESLQRQLESQGADIEGLKARMYGAERTLKFHAAELVALKATGT